MATFFAELLHKFIYETKEFFRAILWPEFLKGAIMGIFYFFAFLLPYMYGVMKILDRLVKNAGYTEDRLILFKPTVQNWWMADNGPIIIFVLGYAVIFLSIHIYFERR